MATAGALWQRYQLVDGLADTAEHFLGLRDFARARGAALAVSRALIRELYDEADALAAAEDLAASRLEAIDELRRGAIRLLGLAERARRATDASDLPSALAAMRTLRDELSRHHEAAERLVRPPFSGDLS